MGVKQLWSLLQGERILEKTQGANPEAHLDIVHEVDGKVIAVDLAMWMMQADQQQALLPHFSKEERCVKVAFERALQWLRHGVLPVVVVEGRPPEEKRLAQQQRFAQRNGYSGGGTARGASQFTRLGALVGGVMQALGLPVFEAPGEAEAVCAALAQAGCVDGCATFDSDVLLYGAESVYQSLKLFTTDAKGCEMTRCRMEHVRELLGLEEGGAAALSVIAMLAGCDYDLDGAAGVGPVGALAMVQHLLQGDKDDVQVLERLSRRLQQPPDTHILSLTKCTGCVQCGHEGGRKSRIKRHSRKNPCPHCPPSQDGFCESRPRASCGCGFHASEAARRVERIAERVRRDPGFLEEAEAALGVFERQGREAAQFVVARLGELGLPLGQKLTWLRRPSAHAVHAVIQSRVPGLLWDLPTVRSKILPVLMEWDLTHPEGQVEFVATEIQKVHGQKGAGKGQGGGDGDGQLQGGTHWRYVLRWERTAEDVEQLGDLEVRRKPPRSRPAAGALDGDDLLLTQPLSPGQRGWAMDVSTQVSPGQAGRQPVEVMTVREFDVRWLKEQPAEHRAVRQAAVRRWAPRLEEAHREKLVAAAAPRRRAPKAKKTVTRKGSLRAGDPLAAPSPPCLRNAPALRMGNILQMLAPRGKESRESKGPEEIHVPRHYGLGTSNQSMGGEGTVWESTAAGSGEEGEGGRGKQQERGNGAEEAARDLPPRQPHPPLPPSPRAMLRLLNRVLGEGDGDAATPSLQQRAQQAQRGGAAPAAEVATGATSTRQVQEVGRGERGTAESSPKRLKSPRGEPENLEGGMGNLQDPLHPGKASSGSAGRQGRARDGGQEPGSESDFSRNLIHSRHVAISGVQHQSEVRERRGSRPEPPMLQHWRQPGRSLQESGRGAPEGYQIPPPQGHRSGRVQSRRGQGKGAVGGLRTGAALLPKSSHGPVHMTDGQRGGGVQPPGRPGGRRGRGRAALHAAAKDHAADIRAFFSPPARVGGARPQMPESLGDAGNQGEVVDLVTPPSNTRMGRRETGSPVDLCTNS